MLGSLKKKFRPEKGQVVVFTVLLLPLILGVVVFVIEIGNIYVHYSDLQNVADTAAIMGNISSAKEVVKQNVKNLSGKGKVAVNNSDEDNFLVKIWYYEDSAPSKKKFYVKLEKTIPMIFFKIFVESRKVDVYAAGSTVDPKKLLPIKKAEMDAIEEGNLWTFEPAEP
ncbi:MAG: Tad domain-containing protein [Selenomonadaceae bacterium]|nr:Tad domain-containing protein [Selenomonadaceae bacterium]